MSEPKLLIICRHGEMGLSSPLSLKGEAQCRWLAEQLSRHAKGCAARILASVSLRARRSAEILGDKLALLVETHGALNDVTLTPEIRRLISVHSERCDALIIVTHHGVCKELLDAIVSEHSMEQGEALYFPDEQYNGTAAVIDYATKTVTLLCPPNELDGFDLF